MFVFFAETVHKKTTYVGSLQFKSRVHISEATSLSYIFQNVQIKLY
jgi:hypothetical protein